MQGKLSAEEKAARKDLNVHIKVHVNACRRWFLVNKAAVLSDVAHPFLSIAFSWSHSFSSSSDAACYRYTSWTEGFQVYRVAADSRDTKKDIKSKLGHGHTLIFFEVCGKHSNGLHEGTIPGAPSRPVLRSAQRRMQITSS